MKIKIIDLLNKIANNEEVPKKIKWGDYELEWEELGYHDYKFLDTGSHLLFQGFETSVLNAEVEILEETKKIDKIKSNGDEFYSDYIDAWISKNKTDAYCEFLMNKINELIDEINNLKEED